MTVEAFDVVELGAMVEEVGTGLSHPGLRGVIEEMRGHHHHGGLVRRAHRTDRLDHPDARQVVCILAFVDCIHQGHVHRRRVDRSPIGSYSMVGHAGHLDIGSSREKLGEPPSTDVLSTITTLLRVTEPPVVWQPRQAGVRSRR